MCSNRLKQIDLSHGSQSHHGSLFKWHAHSYFGNGNIGFEGTTSFDFKEKICPWCGYILTRTEEQFSLHPSQSGWCTSQMGCNVTQCLKCGWYSLSGGLYSNIAHINYAYFVLRLLLYEFSIDDSQNVSLEELGSFLRKHHSDIFCLSWRRFEELIEDVFKKIGFKTTLTQSTWDNGADIIVLQQSSGKRAIVEVKKYAPNRTVGINLIRQLTGAQILHQVQKSYLVTTSHFSASAKEAVACLSQIKPKLEMELWDGIRVLKELDCYDEEVLPIMNIEAGIPLHEQIAYTLDPIPICFMVDMGTGQPITGSPVRFDVHVETAHRDIVYLVGSPIELGRWDIAHSVPLNCTKQCWSQNYKSVEDLEGGKYPIWSRVVGLPPQSHIEYKYVRKLSNGDYVWERGPNRIIRTKQVNMINKIHDTWHY